jgi:hypothetical protein
MSCACRYLSPVSPVFFSPVAGCSETIYFVKNLSYKIFDASNSSDESTFTYAERFYTTRNVESSDKDFLKQNLESLDPLLQLNWRRT